MRWNPKSGQNSMPTTEDDYGGGNAGPSSNSVVGI